MEKAGLVERFAFYFISQATAEGLTGTPQLANQLPHSLRLSTAVGLQRKRCLSRDSHGDWGQGKRLERCPPI